MINSNLQIDPEVLDARLYLVQSILNRQLWSGTPFRDDDRELVENLVHDIRDEIVSGEAEKSGYRDFLHASEHDPVLSKLIPESIPQSIWRAGPTSR